MNKHWKHISNFKNGNTDPTLNDYEYDQNGNMVKDRNKGIASISYNYLNLPEQIVFENSNSIEYTYNAAGVKLKKTVVEETATPEVRKEVDYLDGFQYAGEMLNFFPTAEGYVRATPVGNIAPGSPPTGYAYSYVYNYTDHLGNVRLSYSMDHLTGKLKILEENQYYPFGLRHGVYDTGGKKDFSRNPGDGIEPEPGLPPVLDYVTRMEYQYKYQGQERQDELGLNWDSFKWRNYDYAIGRFMSHDPLSEKYTYNSPYAFQENKMGMGRELEGLELKEWLKDKAQKVKATVNKTVEQGKQWIKNNLVVEVEAKATLGVQAGIKTGFGKIEGGLITTEVGKAGVSTEKGAYAEGGDGKGHNFIGVSGKVLNKNLSVGGKVDYVTKDAFPSDGSDVAEYYSNNGELQYGVNLGPGRSLGTGIDGDYDFLSADTTVEANTECKCIDLGVGVKAILGVEVNLKIGIKNDEKQN